MTEVTGLQQKEGADPHSVRRFAFENVERLSKLPVYIALLLTAVAVYLKSATSARADVHEESEPGATPAGEGSNAAPIDFGKATLPRPDTVEETEEDDKPMEQAEPLSFFAGSASERGNVIDFPHKMPMIPGLNAFAFDTLPTFNVPMPNARAQGNHLTPTPGRGGSGGGGAPAQASDEDEISRLIDLLEGNDGEAPSDAGAAPTPGSGNAGPKDGHPDPAPNDGDGDPEDPRRGNRAPTVSGQARLNDVFMSQVVLIGLSELLTNIKDADGNELTVTDVRVSSGSVAVHDAFWIYTPDPGHLGNVQVSYQVSDGLATVTNSASFEIVEEGKVVPLGSGTSGHDRIIGSANTDTINAFAGNDVIESLAGNDAIHGGAGNDLINAGDGDDTVFAGLGDDVVNAGAGDDEVHGEAGNDTIFGEAGNDTLDGDDGDDQIAGGQGDDQIAGGQGDDQIAGGQGDDLARGGSGRDIVQGDQGNDVLSGGDDADIVAGGEGDDSVAGDAGDDTLYGDAGNDVLDGGQGDDQIAGGAGDDTIFAGSNSDNVEGGSGHDIVQGGEGDDDLSGGDGDDSVAGDAGDDTLHGDAGNDVLKGGGGDDMMDGGGGDDSIFGGEGADTIAGGSGSDYVEGGDGADVIDAEVGADVVLAGGGNDLIVVTLDADGDVYNGGDGSDALDMSNAHSGVNVDLVSGTISSAEIGTDMISGFERIIGGSGDDTFLAGNQSTVLVGAGGNDTFTFAMAASSGLETGLLIHEIIDFMVGDRVMVDHFEISETARDAAEDLFARVYEGQSNGDAAVPIRIRYERLNDIDHTIIDVDFDLNNEFEMSINISGHHTPYVYNNIT